MFVSTRQAAGILAEAGLNREAARRLLLAGLAGPGIRTAGSLLFAEERVRALADRPHVDRASAPETFVGRVGPRSPVDSDLSGWDLRGWSGVDLTAPVAEQRDAVRMFWRLDACSRVLMQVQIERDGFFPFVATVSGFVALGADAVGFTHHGGRRGAGQCGATLELEEPGDWFASFVDRRLHTGPGSHWMFWPTRGGSSADPEVVPRRRRREGTRWLQQ